MNSPSQIATTEEHAAERQAGGARPETLRATAARMYDVLASLTVSDLRGATAGGGCRS